MSETGVTVRDYGRGIPLGKLVDASSKMNTGGKYDSKAFKKSVGLNGVGIKAVNALSTSFVIESVRDGQMKRVEYSCGRIVAESDIVPSSEPDGTMVCFTPDASIFRDYRYRDEHILPLIKKLYLPQHRPLGDIQRQEIYFARRPPGSAEGKHDQ